MRFALLIGLCACGARTELDGADVVIPDAGGDEETTSASCHDEIVAQDAKGAGPLTVLGDDVFWGTVDGFVRARSASKTITTLATEASSIDAIAVDANNVYYTTIGAVHRVPRGGGASSVIVPAAGLPFALVLQDQKIFWVDYGQGILAGSVHSANLDGTGAKKLLDQLDTPGGLALDGTFLYVDAALGAINQTTFKGPMMRAAHDGSGAIALYQGLNEPKGIVAFGGRLYWIEQVDATSTLHGGVFSNGGSASPVLELQTDNELPVDLTVDDGGIYVTALSQTEGGVLHHDGVVAAKTAGVVYEAVRTSATAVYWTIGWTSTSPPPADGASVRKICK